jgi:hypothetical protein
MNNSLNSMPCSNNDHVDRLDFLENEKEETFMFEPINLTPNEPFPNGDLSAMHETYASFVYILTCCYNSHVVLIMDDMFTISFVNLDHALRLVKLMTLKNHMSREGLIFTNHVDKARIIEREVMPKELQNKSSTSPNPAMDAAVFFNFRAYSEVYK